MTYDKSNRNEVVNVYLGFLGNDYVLANGYEGARAASLIGLLSDAAGGAGMVARSGGAAAGRAAGAARGAPRTPCRPACTAKRTRGK